MGNIIFFLEINEVSLSTYLPIYLQTPTNLKRDSIWESVLELRWQVAVHQVLHASLQTKEIMLLCEGPVYCACACGTDLRAGLLVGPEGAVEHGYAVAVQRQPDALLLDQLGARRRGLDEAVALPCQAVELLDVLQHQVKVHMEAFVCGYFWWETTDSDSDDFLSSRGELTFQSCPQQHISMI